jgi:hypothetical protein
MVVEFGRQKSGKILVLTSKSKGPMLVVLEFDAQVETSIPEDCTIRQHRAISRSDRKGKSKWKELPGSVRWHIFQVYKETGNTHEKAGDLTILRQYHRSA